MNFEHANTIAAYLINKHLGETYDLVFGTAKTLFGSCYYPTSKRKGYIRLSKPLIEANDEVQVRDTILHEIAHALVGPGHGHDKVWQAQARKVGANPKATCADGKIAALPKYIMYSPLTKEIVKRYYRKPNKSTFARLKEYQVKGKPETLGTLEIHEYNSRV